MVTTALPLGPPLPRRAELATALRSMPPRTASCQPARNLPLGGNPRHPVQRLATPGETCRSVPPPHATPTALCRAWRNLPRHPDRCHPHGALPTRAELATRRGQCHAVRCLANQRGISPPHGAHRHSNGTCQAHCSCHRLDTMPSARPLATRCGTLPNRAEPRRHTPSLATAAALAVAVASSTYGSPRARATPARRCHRPPVLPFLAAPCHLTQLLATQSETCRRAPRFAMAGAVDWRWHLPYPDAWRCPWRLGHQRGNLPLDVARCRGNGGQAARNLPLLSTLATRMEPCQPAQRLAERAGSCHRVWQVVDRLAEDLAVRRVDVG